MKATNKEEKAMLECYRRLFKASTPSGDFDDLVSNAKLNKRGQKEIPFMDYEIEEEMMSNIVNEVTAEFKIKGYRKNAFRASIYLGCSPKTKTK
jgi:hypothetical protein